MSKSILMPQVGQDLTEGVLITWKVKVGDRVKKGNMVAVVESEKASFEVEAFEEGTVTELLYKEGDTAKVLEPILHLDGGTDESNKEVQQGTKALKTKALNMDPHSRQPALNEPTNARKSPRSSSPLARRLAQQHGLDIKRIAGTGPGGAVLQRDVEKALASAAPSSPRMSPDSPQSSPDLAGDRVETFNRMRQVIADRLLLAKQTIPHFYLRAEIDVTNLLIRRQAHMDMGGAKVSVNDALVHATALTLLEYPRLNAHVAADHIVLKGSVNVGVAISLDDGLVVAVVENTPSFSVAEIAGMIRNYAEAARRGIQKSVAVGTFTISNLGMFGVEVLPIINPPESAILGVGPIRQVIRPHDGGTRLRDIMTVTLAGDHRAIDGAYGARFLQRLGERIQDYDSFTGSS